LPAGFGSAFPYGTFVINVTGSFIIGFFLAFAQERVSLSPYWRLFFAVGFVGGYTTFSTFEYESVRLLQVGEMLLGAISSRECAHRRSRHNRRNCSGKLGLTKPAASRLTERGELLNWLADGDGVHPNRSADLSRADDRYWVERPGRGFHLYPLYPYLNIGGATRAEIEIALAWTR
jgi:hypothetical protein